MRYPDHKFIIFLYLRIKVCYKPLFVRLCSSLELFNRYCKGCQYGRKNTISIYLINLSEIKQWFNLSLSLNSVRVHDAMKAIEKETCNENIPQQKIPLQIHTIKELLFWGLP